MRDKSSFYQSRFWRAETLGNETREFLFHVAGRKLNDSANNHARSRGDRRSAVGHSRCVRVFEVNLIEVYPQLVRDNLAEDRARALTNFRRAREHSRSPAVGDFHSRLSLHLCFAAPGEAGPMEEKS